jgi:PAS domain-containing protein
VILYCDIYTGIQNIKKPEDVPLRIPVFGHLSFNKEQKFKKMINEEQDLTEAQLLRLKAEKKLQKRKIKAADLVMGIEEKRLMHELQVHQIELEMQNDELRLANETKEAALQKYTMLYDFAPMGFFTIDETGVIEDLNFTGAELLNDRRISLMGLNFKLFVAEESKVVFDTFLEKLYADNSKESCEVKLCQHKKTFCTVYLEGVVIGQNRNCLLSVVDISSFIN